MFQVDSKMIQLDNISNNDFRLFSIIGYYKILSSLCYILGPCCLSILYIVVYIC